jgi:ABC-type phosphate/phosphonate transport system ATPase subunit
MLNILSITKQTMNTPVPQESYSLQTIAGKTSKHITADVGLIFTAYNLRRIFNFIDQNVLKKFLKEFSLTFLILSSHFRAFYSVFKVRIYSKLFGKTSSKTFLNSYIYKKQMVLKHK